MTDATTIPTAIEVLQAQGATVPADQAGKYVAALSTLQGLDHRRQEAAKRAATGVEGPTR